MAFLAQLIGAVLGGVAGFAVGGMVVAGAGDMTLDMRFILGGAGAVIGFVIGRVIGAAAEKKNTKGASSGDDD